MTVKELKDMLEKYPENMEVIVDRCSDYDSVDVCDWSVVKAVKHNYGFMRSHPTMHEAYKAIEKEYLHLEGN
jgi:hypothetical protein